MNTDFSANDARALVKSAREKNAVYFDAIEKIKVEAAKGGSKIYLWSGTGLVGDAIEKLRADGFTVNTLNPSDQRDADWEVTW